jgi:transposase-like protein
MNSQVVKLRELLTPAPEEPSPPSRRSKQKQIRLSGDRREAFADAYRAGTAVSDLADEFQINRATVFRLAEQLGLPHRIPILGPAEVEEARLLYEFGLSLVKVGGHLGVAARTVSLALRKNGVPIRARRGWTNRHR